MSEASRSSGDGVVSVCIPAYQAEAFIDRTLWCARRQTHVDQRILVSIDRSTDGTEEICRSHARDDERVEVFAQHEQLGWAGNTNWLLDRAESEFGFVYFHDDLIEPVYTERLVAALREHPDAPSAHCDVRLVTPDGERVRRGRCYSGTDAERLLTYLLVPEKGALLRSMIRIHGRAGRLRMVAGAVFEMELVAAGPAIRVPETLYHRIADRAGGLVDGWRKLPFAELVDGLRFNISLLRQLIDRLDTTEEERDLLDFGLRAHAELRLRWLESTYEATELTPVEQATGCLDELALPTALDTLDDSLRAICESGYDRALRRTANRALHVGEHARAARQFEALVARNPGKHWATRGLREAQAAGCADRTDLP